MFYANRLFRDGKVRSNIILCLLKRSPVCDTYSQYKSLPALTLCHVGSKLLYVDGFLYNMSQEDIGSLRPHCGTPLEHMMFTETRKNRDLLLPDLLRRGSQSN